MPVLAMTKENSPIATMANPVMTEVLMSRLAE